MLPDSSWTIPSWKDFDNDYWIEKGLDDFSRVFRKQERNRSYQRMFGITPRYETVIGWRVPSMLCRQSPSSFIGRMFWNAVAIAIVLPMQMGVWTLRQCRDTIKRIFFPPLYLIWRELLGLPYARYLHKQLQDEGVQVTGTIAMESNNTKQKTIRFQLEDDRRIATPKVYEVMQLESAQGFPYNQVNKGDSIDLWMLRETDDRIWGMTLKRLEQRMIDCSYNSWKSILSLGIGIVWLEVAVHVYLWLIATILHLAMSSYHHSILSSIAGVWYMVPLRCLTLSEWFWMHGCVLFVVNINWNERHLFAIERAAA